MTLSLIADEIKIVYQIWSKLDEKQKKSRKLLLLVGVGWAGRSKNGRRYFKLILWRFCLIISPHTKFHPNRTKNTEVRNFHFWSILVGRAGRSKNGRRHIKLSLCCFCPIISPHTKFHQKTQKLEIFPFGRFWLVRLVGRKMVAATPNIQLPSGRL